LTVEWTVGGGLCFIVVWMAKIVQKRSYPTARMEIQIDFVINSNYRCSGDVTAMC
jgi:hypothetical protein